jgi:hypothetical protein
MTDDDRFELELAALRPRRPSAELKQRIAQELAETISPTRSVSEELDLTYPQRASLTRRVSMVGGLLAASLLAAIVWRGGGQADEVQQVPTLEANVATAFDKTSPTVWSYHRAVLQSSHSLEDVLNKFDAHTLEHKSGGAPDLLAARFNSDLDSFLGEL